MGSVVVAPIDSTDCDDCCPTAANACECWRDTAGRTVSKHVVVMEAGPTQNTRHFKDLRVRSVRNDGTSASDHQNSSGASLLFGSWFNIKRGAWGWPHLFPHQTITVSYSNPFLWVVGILQCEQRDAHCVHTQTLTQSVVRFSRCRAAAPHLGLSDGASVNTEVQSYTDTNTMNWTRLEMKAPYSHTCTYKHTL